MLNVGFIGLGSMGGAMARSITRHLPSLHATHSSLLNVYDHSPYTLTKFAASNKSTPHPSPNLVFSNSSLVFICLPTTSIVKSVLVESQSSISQNSIIVDCTSGDPGESKELGQFVEKTLDAKYFDMPVSGGRAGGKWSHNEATAERSGAKRSQSGAKPQWSGAERSEATSKHSESSHCSVKNR